MATAHPVRAPSSVPGNKPTTATGFPNPHSAFFFSSSVHVGRPIPQATDPKLGNPSYSHVILRPFAHHLCMNGQYACGQGETLPPPPPPSSGVLEGHQDFHVSIGRPTGQKNAVLPPLPSSLPSSFPVLPPTGWLEKRQEKTRLHFQTKGSLNLLLRHRQLRLQVNTNHPSTSPTMHSN